MAKIDRTSEIRIMNNNLAAEIITYRNANDIDIQFENGAIVSHRTYDNFRTRSIKCPLLIQKINEYCKVINVNTQPNTTFLIDTEDIHILGDALWHLSANGYVTVGGGRTCLHRAIIKPTKGNSVNHVNGDKTDNRKCNLRTCKAKECSRTRKINKSNTSGFKGVSWDNSSQKWRAMIGVDYKIIRLGRYDDKLEAAKAYNEAAIKYFGEFANLNIMKGYGDGNGV